MTLNRKQMRLGVLALVGLLAAGAVIHAANRPKWYISATTERIVESPDDEYWVEATTTMSSLYESNMGEVRHYQADGHVVDIPDKGEVRLIAASLQILGKPPEYFDPLGEGGVSEEVRERLKFFERKFLEGKPVLRLFFEGEGIRYLDDAWAFDSRTHWRVSAASYDGDALDDYPVMEHFETRGILAVTLDLGIWHDTSLEVVVRINRFRPKDEELPLFLERAWFRVDQLPGMPNEREITNLFEARFRPRDSELGFWNPLMGEAGRATEMKWEPPSSFFRMIFSSGGARSYVPPPPPTEFLELDSHGMTTPAAVLEAWNKAHPDMILYQASTEHGFLSTKASVTPWHERQWERLQTFWKRP